MINPSAGDAPIDLRSDTVTRPGAAMRAAMAAAQVGDDVYGEDPTVGELEKQTARLLGKEAGLFMPSGTQSNLAAVLTHCGRGDEFIIGDAYHIYCFEAGGAAALGGISPCPVAANNSGGLDAEKVRAAIKADDVHYPRTKLICLENTAAGKPQGKAEMESVAAIARARGLSLHLDGARLLNAAVALSCDAADLAAGFDSVSLCLSKGLGAPVGSVLCGDAGFIHGARRNRKILGGGMRQAGVLAAAGIYALENNIGRLAADHKLARRIADGLAPLFGDAVAFSGTNMIFVAVADCAALIAFLAKRGVLVGGRRGMIRIVTHLDVGESDADAAVKAFADYCEAHPH